MMVQWLMDHSGGLSMAHVPQTFWQGGSGREVEVGAGGSLAQDDLRGTLAVHAVAPTGLLDDCAHGLAHRVEGVHLVELLLRHLIAHRVVILLQVGDKAQQGALGLVAHLPRETSLLLRRLREKLDMLLITCPDYGESSGRRELLEEMFTYVPGTHAGRQHLPFF